MKNYFLFAATGLLSIASFAQKKTVDLLLYNATIYTVDKNFSVASAMAVKDGKILETGDSKKLLSQYDAKEKLDAKGAAVYPGFIDAHSHFLGYGLGLQTANLVGTESWEEILNRLLDFEKKKNLQPGQWLVGRGWDQNDWAVKEFPSKEKLDALFPNNPVMLTRVDGHAAIANQQALKLAGVTASTHLNGGQVEVKNNKLTGILVDNAVGLVGSKIPSPSVSQVSSALMDAQRACFAVGLTSLSDCGVSHQVATLFDSLQKKGLLKMRIYAMLSDATENYNWARVHGKIKTASLNVSSFKVYADGALGSRGACLLQPYTDKPDWTGFLLSSQQHFDSVAAVIYKMNWQMNTHAIGDSGNRTMLKIYSKYLKGKNDRRWRIEHAQVINREDFSLFGKYSIVPSVQPTHATSDMYWAGNRLGAQRLKGAYAYRDLLKENGWIPLGTDFPVEDISPFKTFYAAVFRMDAKGFPAGGFQMENALRREDAICGMTIWAAKAAFEEGEKGSLEKGKFADFVLLDQDLMKASPKAIIDAKVLATYISGVKVYGK
ncbi:amidohydrolase [Flavisolibacter ginsenosidimutans]|uniref:Amidohydrolase n=1 Tax=Flavisolibacter ginsenosidimutans TaxID=661481 RepID=A0A5B8UGF2_9BACT|nr:amidohydrolase [Flavisolibacter ginsenosidimutans]QEC55583.1 amidohydrolase [Flavisolibacter ginsenosidimutans]